MTLQTKEVHGEGVALLFGRSLLWLAFSMLNDIMPLALLESIQTAHIPTREEDKNPVVKRLVSMMGHDATVRMTEVTINESGVNGADTPTVPQVGPIAETPEHYVGENRQLPLSSMGGMESMRRTITKWVQWLRHRNTMLERTDSCYCC